MKSFPKMIENFISELSILLPDLALWHLFESAKIKLLAEKI